MLSVNVTAEPQSGVLLENPHFLQSSFWAEFKSHHGWKSYRFYIELEDSANFKSGVYPVSVLVRTFKKLFSLAYVPLAPEFLLKNGDLPFEQLNEPEAVKEYLEIVKKSAQLIRNLLQEKIIFLRFDPPLAYANDENLAAKDSDKAEFVKLCSMAHLKKAGSDIQPPDTVLLNLEPDEETLLANMKPKWRYNVRLAEKKGVKIERRAADGIDVFYKLYEETSKRDGIALHAKSYYQDLFETTERMKSADSTSPKITMYVASFEDEPLAAIIMLFSPKEAVYLYGASSNSHRNLLPAYLLQWTAIQDAKNYGCKTYDFYGIPPTDDEHHPMYGLYRFKTGFGGAVVHRAGSVDISFSPLYAFYALAEKLRLIWFKKIKKIFVKKGK